MRVAIVTAFPGNPSTPRGGVEAVSVVLVDALRRAGLKSLRVITVRKGLDGPMREEWAGVPVLALPARGRFTLTGALGVNRRQVLAALESEPPDVVHAHDTFGLMAKGVRRPRVLTIHGFIHGDTRVSGQRLAAPRALLWRALESRMWADYPDVVAISPYVRERLEPATSGRIHDIDNPIDARCFDIRREERSLIVLSTAVISRRKNTLGLVDAFARVHARWPAATLRLAGGVVEAAYGDHVRARIAALGLENAVSLLGAIPSAAVRDELARASVYTLVSREENAPLGIEEAMAAGVPVVTSNRCGMPFMVEDGVSGYLVDPESTDDIARRLLDVLGDEPRRRRMGAAGRAIAEARFHPDAVARRTIAVYEGALAAASGARG